MVTFLSSESLSLDLLSLEPLSLEPLSLDLDELSDFDLDELSDFDLDELSDFDLDELSDLASADGTPRLNVPVSLLNANVSSAAKKITNTLFFISFSSRVANQPTDIFSTSKRANNATQITLLPVSQK